MSDKNTQVPVYDAAVIMQSLRKCLVVCNVSAFAFARGAGMSHVTLGAALRGSKAPFQRTLHLIVTEMKRRGWITQSWRPRPLVEDIIEIEGKTFTVTELKSLISKA